jgi:ABC-type transport system involved in multi-copper enzyme maturation permease subunit
MVPALKSEFRKLLTVRSTYVISLIFLLLAGFLAFYVQGFKNAGLDMPYGARSLFVAGTIPQIANTISVAGGLIALLLLAHEYRYNTIVYTLTASNTRSKALAVKILAILTYVFVYATAATLIALGLIWAGASAGGHSLPHQDVSYLTYLAKTVFLCEAYAMAGLFFITLIRNQIGAIAAIFILPNTIEGLLSLLLKKDSVYLPFTALQQVVQAPVLKGVAAAHTARDAATGSLSAPRGALVFLVYLVAGWIVAWVLFLKRDAN